MKVLLTAVLAAVAADPPARNPVTVVTFGDSITAPRGAVITYSTLLQRELPGFGVDAVVVNAGVPGNTTVLARGRFRKDVLDRNPDVVVILLGANDSMVDVWKSPPATESRVPLATTEAALQSFVRAAREKGAEPVLMTMLPFRWTAKLKGMYGRSPYDPADPMGLSTTILKYQKVVRTVARDERVPLVDLYSAFVAYGQTPGQTVEDLYLDGMHPNDRGHRIIADHLLPVVAGLLAPSRHSRNLASPKAARIAHSIGFDRMGRFVRLPSVAGWVGLHRRVTGTGRDSTGERHDATVVHGRSDRHPDWASRGGG